MENFIGRNIQAFRAHKGFSQEGLGNILGVSQTSISAWEDGKSLPRKVNASEFFEPSPSFPTTTFSVKNVDMPAKRSNEQGVSMWFKSRFMGRLPQERRLR